MKPCQQQKEKSLTNLAQLVICRSLSDVADEELLARLPRSLRLALLDLDVSPLDVGAVQLRDGGRGRRLVVHMDETVSGEEVLVNRKT